MKNNWIKLLGLLLVSGALFWTSCGSDDDLVIDTGSGTINASNGLYLTVAGEDPSTTAQLTSENVETDGFASQERSGFVGGYMYLEAGDYNVVQVTDKEITTTIGGTSETVTDEGSSCDFNEYTVVSTVEDGDAFNVAASGLYRVTHDQQTNELVMYQIDAPGIIGAATPGGWDTDTPLTGSVSADGGSWSASGIVLRSGQFKIRMNCRWSIDRRVDSNAGFDAANGYQLYTNFGGSSDLLLNGNDGNNIELTEDGEYTVTANWDPQAGWTLNLDRTGDAPELTFNPNDYQFGIIGAATTGGWDSDQNMFHKFTNDVHTWYGVVSLTDGEYKFRINDAWNFDLGGSIDALSPGGANLVSPGPGTYYVTLSTADEGATWTATMELGGWGIIGEGGPTMGWDNDTQMTLLSMENGVTTYTLTGAFTTGEWKMRAGSQWDLNLGGDLGFLTVDGSNLTMTEAGTYTVNLSFDGEVYSATVELQ